MSAHAVAHLTPEQYLEIERKAECRSEYCSGVMYAMAGGSLHHSVIIGNLAGELRNAIKGRGCLICPGDLRLAVSSTGLYTYPDLMVICGTPAFAHDRQDTVTNPLIIAEVLSPSTERYDRGRKFSDYSTLDSLREYILISQSEPRVEVFRRQPGNDWQLCEYVGLDAVLRVECLDCEIPLAEIYASIGF
jgi:Uma2 family endonuclease